MKPHASKALATASRWKPHPTEQLRHLTVGVSRQQSSYCKPPHFRVPHQVGPYLAGEFLHRQDNSTDDLKDRFHL